MKRILPVFAAILLLAACNGLPGKSTDEAARVQSTPVSTSSTTDQVSPAEAQDLPPQPLQSNDSARPIQFKPSVAVDWDKKIVKNATMELEVTDFNNYNQKLYQTVKKYGGYIAGEDQDLSAYRKTSRVEIKVPVAQFEMLMNELPSGDSKVVERKISSEDVTGAVFDTRARLEAKKEVRSKYLEFLRQSKNMKDMLAVQLEINAIQEQIEAAGTRVNFLNHQAAMSTISLSYFQVLTVAGDAPNENPGYLRRLSIAFRNGAEWMGELLVGLMGIWPLLLILTGGAILLRRNIVKKSAAGLRNNSAG